MLVIMNVITHFLETERQVPIPTAIVIMLYLFFYVALIDGVISAVRCVCSLRPALV